MIRNTHWFVWALLFACLMSGCRSDTADISESKSELKSSYIDDSITSHHNLGWLAAESDPVSESISIADPDKPESKVATGGIVIRKLANGGPASKAGLQTGDVIVRVGDQWLPIKDDPTLDFFVGLESRISAGEPQIEFGIIRNGQFKVLVMTHGKMSLDDGTPNNLTRIDEAADRALEFLASKQNGDGSFGAPQLSGINRLGITASVGLALLGAKDDAYAKEVEESLNFVASQIDLLTSTPAKPESDTKPARPGMIVMQSVEIDIDPLTAAYVMQFLAESEVGMMSEGWMNRLMGTIGAIAGAQTKAGGWNPTETESDSDTATPRIDVMGTHTTNQVVLALGAWERKGMMRQPEAIAQACKYLTDQSEARALGRLDRRTRAALDAGTAAALIAINCSNTDQFFKQIAKDALLRSEDVFLSPVLGLPGLLSTALVARRAGNGPWIRFQNSVRIPLLMLEFPNGSFNGLPRLENESLVETLVETQKDRLWQAAHYAMTLAMQRDPWKRIGGRETGPMSVVRNSKGEPTEKGAATSSEMPEVPGGGNVMSFSMDDLSGEGSMEDQIKEKLKEMGIDSGDIQMEKMPGPAKEKKKK